MKLFIISSSSGVWWDALNDIIVLAQTEEEAIEMVSYRFEEWQKPLTVEEVDMTKSKVVFENFDLG